MNVVISVGHHFTEHDGEQFPPPIGNPSGLDVDVSSLDGLWTVKVQPGVEESSVLSGDHPTLGLGRQGGEVQLGLVRHVHGQPVQVVHVVRVGSDFIWKVNHK